MEAKEALSLPPDPRLTTLLEHQATWPLARPDTNNALWDAPALLTFDATPQEASLQDRDYRGGDRIAPQRHAGCGMGGAKMCEIGRLKSVGLIAALTRSTLDVRPPSGPGQHSPTRVCPCSPSKPGAFPPEAPAGRDRDRPAARLALADCYRG